MSRILAPICRSFGPRRVRVEAYVASGDLSVGLSRDIITGGGGLEDFLSNTTTTAVVEASVVPKITTAYSPACLRNCCRSARPPDQYSGKRGKLLLNFCPHSPLSRYSEVHFVCCLVCMVP